MTGTRFTVKAGGIIYPVSLTDSGFFRAVVAGQEIDAPSLSQLSELAGKAAKGAERLSIPFVRFISASGQREGTLTGVHATQHRTVLIRWSDGTAQTTRTADMGGTTLRPLSTEEKAELAYLDGLYTQASRRLSEFLEARKVHLWEAAQEAATSDG